MPWPLNISPGFETALVLALLAIVAALGLCLVLVWTQFQRLDAQHKQLRLQLNAQLRDQFAVFNTKLSGQITKLKRDLEGTEQKLDDSFQRKMEVLDALLTVLDKPGLGVAFELGVAFAMKKQVVLFRTDVQDYLGKVLEGLWQSHPSHLRAVTVEELRLVLSQLSR